VVNEGRKERAHYQVHTVYYTAQQSIMKSISNPITRTRTKINNKALIFEALPPPCAQQRITGREEYNGYIWGGR
jgi:hypothetical protein